MPRSLRLFSLALLLALSTPLWSAEEEEEIGLEEIVEEEETEVAAIDNLGPTAVGFPADTNFGPESNFEIDPRILRDFIESRGMIECRHKTGTLTIAGDVRARWIGAGEKAVIPYGPLAGKYGAVRGAGTKTALNRFKSEFNLFMDYVAPSTWVSTKMRWSNYDGVDGGSATQTNMDRAFIGFDVFTEGPEDFYIEVGRSRLEYLFDSRVEFSSTFDGIHIYYTDVWPRIGTFVIHGGPFIVDSFTNNYAWAMETYVNRWVGTPLCLKYSLIHWRRRSTTKYTGNYGTLKDNAAKDIPATKPLLVIDNPRYQFLISQILFFYDGKIKIMGSPKVFYPYAAALVNHDAKRWPSAGGKLANGAWYAGVTIGKLCKACDWSLDVNYQVVGAQAVPDFDLSGIGHGNTYEMLFSDSILFNFVGERAQGFCNYRGWEASLMLALSENLSLRTKGQVSTPLNKSIGGDFFYKAFELSAIYAF